MHMDELPEGGGQDSNLDVGFVWSFLKFSDLYKFG